MRSKVYILIITVVILSLIGLYFFSTPEIVPEPTWGFLELPNKRISLLVADTPMAQTQGLGGRDSLPQDFGMLFIFNRPDLYGIWMKDMKFPLDIIWLSEKSEVVHIEENITPETFPQSYFPPAPSLYVLEVNAGFADENGLQVGNVLNFQKK